MLALARSAPRLAVAMGMLLAGLGLSDGTQTLANSRLGSAGSGRVQTRQPFAQQVAELRSTRSLLEKADHDYRGHRAKAVHEISVAIHALEHGHHHAQTGSFRDSKSGGGNREPQAVSDAQLRKAIHQLKTVESQLHGATDNSGRHKAHTAIHKAIHELETALKIR
jgi:hypothetical protein